MGAWIQLRMSFQSLTAHSDSTLRSECRTLAACMCTMAFATSMAVSMIAETQRRSETR